MGSPGAIDMGPLTGSNIGPRSRSMLGPESVDGNAQSAEATQESTMWSGIYHKFAGADCRHRAQK